MIVGTGVTAPILRYNPAVVAQVFATLGCMFPGRVFLGLGKGESLNEVPAGASWPSNLVRFERLEEAIKLIKLLWMEDWVTFRGKYKLLPAFRDGAMKAGRNPEALDKVLFMPASYDPDKQKALESIGYWRGAMVKVIFEVNFPDPRKIEESAQVVGMDTMEKTTLIVSSADEATKKLDKYVRLGFTEIVLINSSPNRESFIKPLSQEIAP
jgi:coenzyme F420-dependent glucose-6-phosphate dehydrogenase